MKTGISLAVALVAWSLLPCRSSADPLDDCFANGDPIEIQDDDAAVPCDPFDHWYSRPSGTNVLTKVTYGGGLFAAVGNHQMGSLSVGSIVTSSNGFNWTVRSDTGAFVGAVPAAGIAYGNGNFIAITAGGEVWYSTDGVRWYGPSYEELPAPQTSIAFGNGVFVTVGINGSSFILSNPQGYNRVAMPTNQFKTVAFGNGRFVAVGNTGAVAVATTIGMNAIWMNGMSGTVSNLADVTFGNGLFVAVGAGGTLLTSPDGLAWSPRESGTRIDFTTITYGAGRFLAIGNEPVSENGLSTSIDGVNWLARSVPSSDTWSGAAYGNNSFVLVGQQGSVLSAPVLPFLLTQPQSQVLSAGDPVSFTVEMAASCPITYQWQHDGLDLPGATGPTLFLPSVAPEDAGSYTVRVASDGVNFLSALASLQVNLRRALDYWTPPATAPGSSTLNALACGVGALVAVGNTGTILRSLDGENWFAAAAGTNAMLQAVAYGLGTFVAVGNSGVILTSLEGAAWTLRDSGTIRTLRAIAFGNGTFVVVGDSGVVLSSPDGIAWTSRDTGANRTLLCVTFAAGQFVAVGAGGFTTSSPDGVEWTSHPSGFGLIFYAVTWGRGAFVAVGNGGTIIRSTDGVAWTQQSAPVTSLLGGVTFGLDQFVAVGVNGVVLSSPDGLAWTARTSGVTSELTDVISCGDRFLAVGANGLILRSAFAGLPHLAGHLTSAGFELRLTGEIGASFRLQTTPTLPAGDWLTLQSFTNTRVVTTLLDPTATNVPQRFYRVVSP